MTMPHAAPRGTFRWGDVIMLVLMVAAMAGVKLGVRRLFSGRE